MIWRFLALASVCITIGLDSDRSVAAENYPVTGAWAYVNSSSPQLQDKACQAFQRFGLAKMSGDLIGGGEMIVFNGTKRHNFGGYADDVTPNLSIRRLSDNSFDVVDRWISDGEGGIRPGPQKRRYVLKIIDPNMIEIKEGRYPATRYVKCSTQSQTDQDDETASLLRSANLKLPDRVSHSISELRKDCPFKTIPVAAIRSLELNGDGVDDYIIDYGELGCTSFCGSAGCVHEIWVSQDGQFIQTMNENIRGIDRVVSHGPSNDLVVAVHGSACNLSGADACYYRLHWTKSKMSRDRIAK